MDNIEAIMADEIATAHTKAQELIETAHRAVKDATEASSYVGALIDKVQPHKKSTVYQWVGEQANVAGETARSYVLAHKTSAKRMAHSDRRCLLKLGILEAQVSTAQTAKLKRPPTSLSTKIHRANKSILNHLKSRPVSEMTGAEKVVLKHNLEGLARVYLDASK
jgi:hypothetical protein